MHDWQLVPHQLYTGQQEAATDQPHKISIVFCGYVILYIRSVYLDELGRAGQPFRNVLRVSHLVVGEGALVCTKVAPTSAVSSFGHAVFFLFSKWWPTAMSHCSCSCITPGTGGMVVNRWMQNKDVGALVVWQ